MPKGPTGKVLEFDDGSAQDARLLRLEDQVSNLREDTGSTKTALKSITDKIDDLSTDFTDKLVDLKTNLNERLDNQDEAIGKVNVSLEKHEKTLEEIQTAKKKAAERVESWKKWLGILGAAGIGALVKVLVELLLK